jgi:hypothetical protein
MCRPVIRLAWSDHAWRPFRFLDGRQYEPILCRVAVDGYWIGKGGVLVVGWFMLWWQFPQRFVQVGHDA